MSENTDDLESHSWPGFVDILSAAIMMFVFFVLITAVALFFHVITFTSKQDSAQSELENTQAQMAELQVQNQELKTAIGGLQKKILETEATFSEQEGDQRISWSDDGMSAVVFFGTNSITVTEQTDQELQDFAKRVLSRYAAANLKLRITSPKTTSGIDTIARKVAVARIFNVRNSFLDSAVNKEQTFLNVLPPEAIEDDHDWAKIQFEVVR